MRYARCRPNPRMMGHRHAVSKVGRAAGCSRTLAEGCCNRLRSGSRDASSRLSGPGDVDVTCAHEFRLVTFRSGCTFCTLNDPLPSAFTETPYKEMSGWLPAMQLGCWKRQIMQHGQGFAGSATLNRLL